MKYRRLKTIAGDGTITRYYDLASGEDALCNAFYGITSNKASKIEGTVGESVELIGFSHGGDNVVKGKLLLDINPAVEYMGILGEGEDRPAIGDVVNGYQKVTGVHYDGDDGYNPGEFGVEALDAPYYIFTIVQPAGTSYATEVDDDDAGEESGRGGVTP